MKFFKRTVHSRLIKNILAAGIAIAMAPAIPAAIVGPFTVDGSTLHLWHFDEINGTPVNAHPSMR
jgi:hypothetical protein